MKVHILSVEEKNVTASRLSAANEYEPTELSTSFVDEIPKTA